MAGQAFFVTNDAPLPFWDFLSAVLTGFGYPAPRCVGACIRGFMPSLTMPRRLTLLLTHAYSVRLPAGFMGVVGGMMDALASGLGAVGVKFQPTFTRSRVQYLTTHHYYSIEKVRRLRLRSFSTDWEHWTTH